MGRNGRKRKCVVGKRRSLFCFFWIASEPIQTTEIIPLSCFSSSKLKPILHKPLKNSLGVADAFPQN